MIYALLIVFSLGIFIYSKKWKTKKKIFVAFYMIISVATFYILFILFFWNLSVDQGERKQHLNDYQKQHFKSIFFKNHYGKTIYVIVNLIYSEKEIHDNRKIVDYYNKIDSVILKPNEKTMIFLPISKDDDTKFPANFSVMVKDSVFNTIKIYNEELFLKESVAVPTTKLKERYKSNSWELNLKK